MNDQAKIERVLRLIILLSGNFGHSIKEISQKLEISERTTYRYIDTFRNVGLIIEKNTNGFWKLEKNSSYKELNDLLHFSEEESYILQKAIHSIDDNNVLKSNLISKLYSLYDSQRVIGTIIKKEKSEIIGNLLEAAKKKRQVIIESYQSANSSTISNRLVEPIKFTTNFVSIWCYEPESNSTKLFKTSRIKSIEILNNDWEHEKEHNPGFIDCFRISTDKRIPVKLKLTLRAKNLLTEEYPLAEPDIIKISDERYLFESFVCNFTGVGRFVLGLPDDVKVISPLELKNHLNDKIKNKTF